MRYGWHPEGWTEAEDLALIVLWRAGVLVSAIASNFPRRTTPAVQARIARLRQLGVDVPPRDGNAQTPKSIEWALAEIERNLKREARAAPLDPQPLIRFEDSPRAIADHGSSQATLVRPVTNVRSQSSAAWAV